MTLQKKTLIVITLTFIGRFLVLYFASQLIVLGSFAEQENLDTRQNVQRVQSALSDNLDALEGTTRDWSVWDDTYTYIQDKNAAYFSSNLAGNAPMITNRLNLMLFVDANGNTVFEKSLDYRAEKEEPAPDGLREHIYAGSPLLQHSSPESSIKGILSLTKAPMLIASEPIVASDGTGLIRGTLIFGRWLDTREIERFARTTLLGLTLHSVDDPQLPADLQKILPALKQTHSTQVQSISSSSIAGYTMLDDVYGKQTFILKANMPRDVYTRGQDAVRYYSLTSLVIGVAFALVILFFLKSLVLSRLAGLNKSISSIASSGDLSARVSTSGSDELSHLATTMNNMLSALQRSYEDVREGEARYRAVVEQTSEAILLVDTETQRLVQANAAAESLLGYTPKELGSLTLDDILADSEAVPTHTTGNLRQATERRYVRKDGSLVQVEVSDSQITYGGRDVLCIVARDITDRKRADALLRELAMRDGLTGLYNRREMQRLLKEASEQYERCQVGTALILLDVDYFKTVNDTYGHQVGDDVLRWISHLITELVRPEDKVARYGGEELAIVMRDTDTKTAFDVAEHIRQTLEARPFEFVQRLDFDQESDTEDATERKILIPLTLSLGVASMPEDARSEEALLEAADQALYEAKRAGRNRTLLYNETQMRIELSRARW